VHFDAFPCALTEKNPHEVASSAEEMIKAAARNRPRQTHRLSGGSAISSFSESWDATITCLSRRPNAATHVCCINNLRMRFLKDFGTGRGMPDVMGTHRPSRRQPITRRLVAGVVPMTTPRHRLTA
jgi:hypothetical protein